MRTEDGFKETKIGVMPVDWEALGRNHAEHQAEEKRKAGLQALFKTMLHQLMTGQVRVLALTPHPHPA